MDCVRTVEYVEYYLVVMGRSPDSMEELCRLTKERIAIISHQKYRLNKYP